VNITSLIVSNIKSENLFMSLGTLTMMAFTH